MKKNYFTIIAFIFFGSLSAQELQKNFINYQGVARNAENELMVGETIVIGIALKVGGRAAAPDYIENHSISTDANGVFSLKIGNGDPLTGDYNNFGWGNGATFVTVSVNGNEVGTTEMMAVPYALSSGDGAQQADEVPYDNSVSGLPATNAQEALDALAGGGTIDTDNQGLVLTGDLLTIQDGSGSIDLSVYVDDADADINNELQTLDFDPATNALSLSDGNTVIIPSGGTDADADPTNEFQNLSFDAGTNELSLTNGNSIVIPSGGTDSDADPTNEFQNLSFDAGTNELSLTNGNSIVIPTGGTDADADPTNEFQNLSFDAGTNELSLTNGNSIVIPTGGTDADADPTNEFQNLSFDAGTNELSLSDGNSVVIPSGGTDADADPTNEIQDISLVGDELSITGGSTVVLPSAGGTDDQNLVLTGDVLTIENGTGTVDLGDYRDADTTTQNGILQGDGASVIGLIGTANGQVPKWDAGTNTWTAGNDETGGGGTSSGLEAIDEGNGIGWRLIGRDPANYINIGENASDLSTASASNSGVFAGASGNYSIATGLNTQASGLVSTAIGQWTLASGASSTAMGFDTKAIGAFSTSSGEETTASGIRSTAMGFGSLASGSVSTAMGEETVASGEFAVAMGDRTLASEQSSTAFGAGTRATNTHATAMGNATTASGQSATAMGNSTKAESRASFAIGRNNIGGGDPFVWQPSDPLFEIGNGSETVTSNALTVLKNGNTGIGIVNPTEKLEVEGTMKSTDLAGTGQRNVMADADGKLVIGSGGGGNSLWVENGSNISYSAGNVGMGTVDPKTTLDIAGGQWDLNNTNGDFRIGNDTRGLRIGVATGIGPGGGDVRLRAQGGTDRLLLGAGNEDLITITPENVGIGVLDPSERLHVNGRVRLSNLEGIGTRNVMADQSGNLVVETSAIKSILIGYNLFVGNDILYNFGNNSCYFSESGRMQAFIDLPKNTSLNNLIIYYYSKTSAEITISLNLIDPTSNGILWGINSVDLFTTNEVFGDYNLQINSPAINWEAGLLRLSFYAEDWDDIGIVACRVFYQ